MSKKYNPIYDPNFVGYYCAAYNEDEAGIIKNTEENAENYFIEILESLPSDLKKRIKEIGLLNKPKKHGKSFDIWSSRVYRFFKEEWVRWIPVTEKEPDEDRLNEEICFYVSIPEEEALCIFDSPSEANSSIIVFMSKGPYKTKPKLIPIPEDDDYVEDLDDSDDDEETEEESEEQDFSDDWSLDKIWNGKKKY